MQRFDVVIVGAGHNGLIAAAYLARAGKSVFVAERRAIVGGACVTEEIAGAPGYRVSTGAAQLGNLPPAIVADLDLEAHGYELLLPDPLIVFPTGDGGALTLWRDRERTLAGIAALSARDAAALPAFQADCAAFCTILEPMLDAPDTPTAAEVEAAFAAAGRPDLHRAFVLGSVRGLVASRFEHPTVQAALGLTGMFGTNGGPDTPGTAYVMAHHLFGATTGVRGQAGYVRGGMGGLADALAASAQAAGAVIRTDAEVARIEVLDGQAQGVTLWNGDYIEADAIVSNADPKVTFLKLVGRENMPEAVAEEIAATQTCGQALKVNCALDRLPTFTAAPEGVVPARVTICPSLDYAAQAWTDAAAGRMSAAPFMTVHMQSAIDPSLAPAGRHTLTAYAHYFPNDLKTPGGWTPAARAQAGETILDVIARHAPDVRDAVTATEVMAPPDLEARFAMTGGHQFHGDMLAPALFAGRPAPGVGDGAPIRALYLCGAGAHPGGCVWGAGGRRVARVIAAG